MKNKKNQLDDQAHEARRVSESRYRRLFETARDGILLLNAKTAQIEDVNPYLIGMLGYSHAELLGKKLWEVGAFADIAQSKEMFAVLQDVGFVRYENLPLKTRSGARIAVEFVSNSYDCEGIKVIQCNIRDITARKELERLRDSADRLLRESETFSIGVLNSLSEQVAVVDKDGVIIAVNNAWRRFALGNDAPPLTVEPLGINYLDVCERAEGGPTGEEAAAVRAGLLTVLSGEQPEFLLEYPCHSPQEQRWFQVRVTPLLGVRSGAVISHENITRRKLSEVMLGESEERYRTLVEKSPEAITIHRDGIFVYFNPAASKLIGATSDNNMLGRPIAEVFAPGSQLHVQERLWHAAETSESTSWAEARFIRMDGSLVSVETNSSLIDYDGKPAWYVIARDKTDQIQAEIARNVLEMQLRESQKMEALGTMAGGIAHDFNNALATILGNVELVRQDTTGNAPALESLQEIQKAGTRARDLVRQILSFSRRKPTERNPINIAPIVQESANLLRRTLPARLSLSVYCAPEVPKVLADPTQIEQILINLATNAMQAMPRGPGRIDLRLDTVMLDLELAGRHPELVSLCRDHPGSTVRLTVTDTGIGMDVGTMKRIFEPFFTTKPVDEGTGLGLAVVYGMVKGHGGAITAQSEPGQGATFIVYLPAAVAEDGVAQPPASAAADGLVVRDGGHRILYIDDDEALAFLVRRLLERRGFRVNAYTDPEEALTAVRSDPQAFDLVLTDYNMPGLSGVDVARAVRQIRADLPVAVASGFVDEVLRSQANEAGVRKLLLKADDVEVFCTAIQLLVDPAGQSSCAT